MILDWIFKLNQLMLLIFLRAKSWSNYMSLTTLKIYLQKTSIIMLLTHKLLKTNCYAGSARACWATFRLSYVLSLSTISSYFTILNNQHFLWFQCYNLLLFQNGCEWARAGPDMSTITIKTNSGLQWQRQKWLTHSWGWEIPFHSVPAWKRMY